MIDEFASEYYSCMVVGMTSAMASIRPGAKYVLDPNKGFIYWDDPNGLEPPTKEELEEVISRHEKIANHFQYHYDRHHEYPNIESQLDLIWHDLNENKNLKDGDWFKMIKSIKEKYPKSEPSEDIYF